jgi:4-hydroxy-3-polyprenylbenzoate decarboxylase
MLRASNAGAVILPAMPAFYFKPDKIEDLADFIASKIFNIIGVSSGFVKSWTDESK